jgi:hypothetical protein
MIFETIEGKRMIALHSPNTAGCERAVFYEAGRTTEQSISQKNKSNV